LALIALPAHRKIGTPIFARGRFDIGGRAPETTDARVEFVVGMFQDTPPERAAVMPRPAPPA
jgi:hypothetical protein